MTTETFQLPLEAAEAYEEQFVPALFSNWAPQIVEAAGIAAGQRVLDVACGTGIVARTVADRIGAESVIGVDRNDAMLTVARRIRPDIEWRKGDAHELPFPDSSFDAVLCQAGMMFFSDPTAALREMARVAVAQGMVAVQVWDRLEAQEPYLRLAEVAARHAGPDAVELLGAYFVHGDLERFLTRFSEAGLDVTATRTATTTMLFPSVEHFVRVEVEATPLVERLSDESYRRIREESEEALAKWRVESGGAQIPISGHIITARRG